jgi:hypothetical protein
MKHISTSPRSRRVKPHYEHVADRKQPTFSEGFAAIGQVFALFNKAVAGIREQTRAGYDDEMNRGSDD